MRHLFRALALAALLGASPALAQDEDPAESRSATFEAAEGAQAEEIPGGTLMVVAYGIVWLLVLGYVASIAMRQARTAADVKRLEQELAKKREKD